VSRPGAADVQEKRIAFASREVPIFVQMLCIGYHMAEIRRGEVLRIHEYEYSNSNGDERGASPYARESTERSVGEMIARLKLPLVTRRDGLDLLVIGRTP
jgi:hypothetical protein